MAKEKKERKDISFNSEDYMIEKEVETRNGIKLVKDYKKEYRSHFGKCKIRAAKAFNVSVGHLKEAYRVLNGKKIDGFFITELIDRFGFSNGRQLNRVDLARNKGYSSSAPVDIATDKAKDIIGNEDVQSAYLSYIEELKVIKEKQINEDAILGE